MLSCPSPPLAPIMTTKAPPTCYPLCRGDHHQSLIPSTNLAPALYQPLPGAEAPAVGKIRCTRVPMRRLLSLHPLCGTPAWCSLCHAQSPRHARSPHHASHPAMPNPPTITTPKGQFWILILRMLLPLNFSFLCPPLQGCFLCSCQAGVLLHFTSLTSFCNSPVRGSGLAGVCWLPLTRKLKFREAQGLPPGPGLAEEFLAPLSYC